MFFACNAALTCGLPGLYCSVQETNLPATIAFSLSQVEMDFLEGLAALHWPELSPLPQDLSSWLSIFLQGLAQKVLSILYFHWPGQPDQTNVILVAAMP